MHGLEPIPVADFSKATEFWSSVLGTVGYAPQHQFAQLQTFGKAPDCPNFSIVQGQKEKLGKREIQLQVEDSEEVVELVRRAVKVGGKKVEVPELVEGGERFMGKFLDLDGNTVVVYCWEEGGSESQEF
jgi:predicted enzyme related to lactoylglutathione lyase